MSREPGGGSAIISITRLRLRSLLFLPGFLVRNEAVVRQILRAPGFMEGKLLLDSGPAFWTATAWRDETQMRAFRDTNAHRQVMPKLLNWCDEAAVAEISDRFALPSWPDIHALLIQYGRTSRVRHPSANQAERKFPPPRWTRTERRLLPVATG